MHALINIEETGDVTTNQTKLAQVLFHQKDTQTITENNTVVMWEALSVKTGRKSGPLRKGKSQVDGKSC